MQNHEVADGQLTIKVSMSCRVQVTSQGGKLLLSDRKCDCDESA